jgi:hypothetical protein
VKRETEAPHLSGAHGKGRGFVSLRGLRRINKKLGTEISPVFLS